MPSYESMIALLEAELSSAVKRYKIGDREKENYSVAEIEERLAHLRRLQAESENRPSRVILADFGERD